MTNQVPETTYQTEHEREAYARGVDAARAAATWVADGNTDDAHCSRVLTMLAEGDPEANDYLPRQPNLSGEYADDPTPYSIARDYCAPPDIREVADETGEFPEGFMEAVAEAFETGVADTFEQACESELRKHLGVPDDRSFDEWRLDECAACELAREDHPWGGCDEFQGAPELGTFTLTIETGNAAMRTREDVARAVRDVADKIGPDRYRGIRDDNGNTVGHWTFD